MKKRIIAFLLVAVMAVMALAGCAAPAFNYASEDLSQYAEFDAEKFAAALATIEIEDFDFTTDEQTRAEKVSDKIYSTLTDKVVAVEEKVTNGLIGERDVVYYNYYCTVTDKDSVEHIVFYESMDESRLNNSSYKNSHVIELGKNVESEDEAANEFREKLVAALVGKTMSAAYSTVGTKGEKLAAGDKVVITYTLSKTGSDGKLISKDTVNFETVTLGGSDPFLSAIVSENDKNSVGNPVVFPDNKKEFVTTDGSGNTLTYSSVTVKWKIKDAGEELATFEHIPYKDTTKLVKDVNNKEVDLKGLTLTYHVFPVNMIHVPEYNATTLLKYILGSSIKANSLEILEDESYTVEGGAKLPELVEELIKVYSVTTEAEKYKALRDAKAAYDAAKKTVDDAGKNATTAQKDALENAEKALDEAKKAASATAIAEILTATSTTEGAKPISEALTSEYSDNVRHNLEDEYNTSVIKAIAKKVYEAIDKSVTITSYPQSVVDEAYKRLYEGYEYSFYNEKHGSESEYTFHKGDFADYLKSHTEAEAIDGDLWRGIEAKITEQAKESIAPVIKIFVVAKELKEFAKVDLAAWAELDKTAGIFEVELDREDYETDEEFNEAKAEAEEDAKETYENAKEEAETFLVTDEVLAKYRDRVGKAAYDNYIQSYGEANLRTALQFEKLMNYLTSITREREDGHDHPTYVEREDVLYLAFRFARFDGLLYTTVEDADAVEK